jgi:hypothetical protein
VGVRMKKARDRLQKDRIVTREQCERGYRGEFICEKCLAPVVFVARYEKRYYEKIVEVPSFFRLMPNRSHAGNCSFDTVGCVRSIARDSDSAVERSIVHGKWTFSLQILHQQSSEDSRETGEGDADPSLEKRKDKVVNNSGTAIDYITTLHQILSLRAQMDDITDLSACLTLKYGKKKIPWKRFYFEVDTYIDAFDLLHERKASHQHPICVQGVVKDIRRPTDNFEFYSVKLYSPWTEEGDTVKEVPSVEINCPPDIMNKTLTKGAYVLTYGLAKTKIGNKILPRDGDIPLQFLDIKFWINHPDQILVMNSEDAL